MQQPLYHIKNLTSQIKGETVLSITNFEVHRGIVYAIIGPAGAGKTQLLEILANSRKPLGGSILYDGEPMEGAGASVNVRDEVCFLRQAPLTGWRTRGTVERYMLREIRTASWSADSVGDRLKEMGRRMGLANKLGRPVKTLSPGERRWIDLAVCMASDTKVLIIDELELHLGPDELDLVKRQIQGKTGREGATVIISTLNPNTMRKLTGVSVTLDRGRIAMIRSVRDGGRGRRSQGAGGGSRPPRREGNQGRRSASPRR